LTAASWWFPFSDKAKNIPERWMMKSFKQFRMFSWQGKKPVLIKWQAETTESGINIEKGEHIVATGRKGLVLLICLKDHPQTISY
jgi:hypothetical protein